ncbi:helix-turn-helix transcriptional regulator [Pseudogulbenkiania ferrooxidans]|uniref:Transcriptional regulator, XRE family n=1 Tax=Pseudogulbenkiania ferrooxidans 2002 TaxID=279714 RepID=B9Z4X9_9NEIS|nr:helix-turn-helix transcriptional regulator [Pseudogulbenkiania ferrooxidans]EEG08211.1 transcriptional regulator, XRE family [Pseudogulbenkiania ferrooxidans 2002]
MTPMKEARKRLGLTQNDLAKAVGASQAHISKLENGTEQVSPDLAKRLAVELGLDVVKILYPNEKH